MRWWVLSAALAILSVPLPAALLTAQESESAKYSPEVVAKADKILEKVGLRRTGKSIQSTGLPEISRALSGLTREKRQLRLVHQDWQQVVDRGAAISAEMQRLNTQYGELNVQLARVAGVDVSANNRIVGLLNATTAKTKTLMEEREQLKDQLKEKRAALDKVEAAYAETVLAIRRDFDVARDRIAASLKDEDVQIALKVMHVNFGSAANTSADRILAALDKRIGRVEQEIFRETIDLELMRGALAVDAVIGRKTMRMIVDSGATYVTLPSKTAGELGITVPIDAREMKMVLADGTSIPARGVTLPRVRVGEFEAENVEAVVLDAAASNAHPLLGMSFLSNFKVEIDPAAKTLTMLRVSAD